MIVRLWETENCILTVHLTFLLAVCASVETNVWLVGSQCAVCNEQNVRTAVAFSPFRQNGYDFKANDVYIVPFVIIFLPDI